MFCANQNFDDRPLIILYKKYMVQSFKTHDDLEADAESTCCQGQVVWGSKSKALNAARVNVLFEDAVMALRSLDDKI